MFRGLNRSSSSFIKVEAKVDRSRRPTPQFTRKDLLRELVCDHCGRDYGVYAIGLFCPDCGAPNLRLHFAREVELVSAQVDLAEQTNTEQQELGYRLLGNAHEDVLTAFEATLKAVFLFGWIQLKTEAVPRVGNDFQNIERGRKRFADLDCDPLGSLSSEELDALQLNIQKRHVIGHNLGVIDHKFEPHDADAKIGETLQLVGEDIRVFAAISQRVADHLDAWLVGSRSPTIGQTEPPLLREKAVRPDDPDNLSSLNLKLSLLARKIALWIARRSQAGLREFVDTDALQADFPEVPQEQISEAIEELNMDGFIDVSRMLGRQFPPVRPNLDLYMSFDGIALGTKPSADLAVVLTQVLDGPDAVNIEGIFAKTEWPARRFNPAIAAVAGHMSDGQVLRSGGPPNGMHSMVLMGSDRVALKRYLARLT